jgi:hypothetical protein
MVTLLNVGFNEKSEAWKVIIPADEEETTESREIVANNTGFNKLSRIDGSSEYILFTSKGISQTVVLRVKVEKSETP